jgi:hypothetical protein
MIIFLKKPAMKNNLFLFFISFLIIHSHSEAQNDSTFQWMAFVDGYFTYDFNEPQDDQVPFATQTARHNEFNINHALLYGRYSGNRIRASVGLHTGTYPINNYANEPNDLTRMIYEASAGVRLGKNSWIDVGVMPGHIGYEAALSIDREVYTSAYNTEYTPYYMTGIRYTNRLSEKVELTGVLLNGWQNIFETNEDKAFGIALKYNPTENWEFYYANYFGNNGTDEDKKYMKYNHVYARYQISTDFMMAASFDIGLQEKFLEDSDGHIIFIMWLSEYYFSDNFSLSGRYEYTNDDGVLVIASGTEQTHGNTFTLNGNYHFNNMAKVRLEAKYVSSNNDIFVSEDSSISDNTLILSASLAVRFGNMN